MLHKWKMCRIIHAELRRLESESAQILSHIRDERTGPRCEWYPEQINTTPPVGDLPRIDRESGWRELSPMRKALASFHDSVEGA